MGKQKEYRAIYPVGQFDENACWAASLSWWLKAMGIEKRIQLSQSQLITEFTSYCDEEGAMAPSVFKNVICQDARFRLECRFIDAASLPGIEITGPTIIIYKYPELGGTHMNVIYSWYKKKLLGMEPYYPIKAPNGKRSGMHFCRSAQHFINSQEIGIASAAD